MDKPIILIAIADYRTSYKHLRELGTELDEIVAAFRRAIESDICEVKVLADATVEKIVKAFSESQGRIVCFHFAGHANGFQLMLEEHADAGEFAKFLGVQNNLQLVFLNGCSTQRQVVALHENGIPIVIATSYAIQDKIAREVAKSFYVELGKGKSIISAFEKYNYEHRIKKTPLRSIFLEELSEDIMDEFPWKLYCKKGAEKHLEWDLTIPSNTPLFGLPHLEFSSPLPPKPFRYLNRFERKHAELFFGRGTAIKQLYEYISEPHFSPVILLYGQSGVGKSSLLDAGLIPRLESEYEVKYIRRDKELGLSGTLVSLFEDFAEKSLLDHWRFYEEKLNQPLIVILDQVEESLTHPHISETTELKQFINLIQQIFGHATSRPKGRIILGYRKEFHPEIVAQLETVDLPYEQIFLQKLNKGGIIAAITGLIRYERPRKKYRLSIEEGLADIIADDLEEDRHSAIAPVLQILLSKMWEKACLIDSNSPFFSIDLYQQLKREGILLTDFLHQKLRELKQWNEELADSGLMLDILMFHTTTKSTSSQRKWSELLGRYPHHEDLLAPLLREMKNKYLLVDTSSAKKSIADAIQSADQSIEEMLSLAHDTLAPLVREQYEVSDRPGQMADRILRNKLVDWLADQERGLLDENSLELVEKGKTGMRVWMVDEEKLIQASQEQREKNRKRRRQLRIWGALAIGIISILSVVSSFMWMKAEQDKKRALSSAKASESLFWLERNPTYSHSLARESYSLDTENDLAYSALLKSYYQEVYEYDQELFSAPFYETLIENERGIYMAEYDPKGQKIIAAMQGGLIHVYDAISGELIQELENDGQEFARAVQFSQDGKYILGASDNGLWVWQADGQLLAKAIQVGRIYTAKFSSNSDEIVFGHEHELIYWNWRQDSILWKFAHPKLINDISVLGEQLATACSDQLLRMFDLNGNLLDEFMGHSSLPLSVRFAPYDQMTDQEVFLASGDVGGTILLWNRKGEILHNYSVHKQEIYSLRFSPNGHYLLSGSWDHIARIWNLESGNSFPLKGHEDAIFSAVFSPDGKQVLTASFDQTIRKWDLTQKPFKKIAQHTGRVNALEYALQAHKILSASDDSTLKVIDQNIDLEETIKLPNIPTKAIFSSKENIVIAAGDDGSLTFWNYKDHQHKNMPIGSYVSDIAYENDGQILAIADDNYVLLAKVDFSKIWESDGVLFTDTLPYQGITKVKFSPKMNDLLAASQWSKRVNIWDLKNHTSDSLIYPAPVQAVQMTDDEQILVVGLASNREQIVLYHFKNQHNMLLNEHISTIEDIKIAPSMDYFASASNDGTIKLWNMDGQEMGSLDVGGVSSLAFSYDGHYIIYGTKEGELFEWPIDPEIILP